MKSLYLSIAGLALLGLGANASSNSVDLPVGWQDPGSSVGVTFSVGVDDRWMPPQEDVAYEPGEVVPIHTSALAANASPLDGDDTCSTSETTQSCSTANVKKCSTGQSNLKCSTFSHPVTCSTTAAPGTQCTAFGRGECSTEDNVCSAKGEGWCSATGGSQAECSATGKGYCSVHSGEGGTCTTMGPQGKCSAGEHCSTWDDSGNMIDDGSDGTCKG